MKLYLYGLFTALTLAACTQKSGDVCPEDQEGAFKWHSAKAADGDAESIYQLAHCYLTGKGVDKNTKKARELFESASNNGHAAALFEMWKILRSPNSNSQDLPKALDMLRCSANLGNADAQFTIGNHYLKGALVKQDPDEALRYLSMASAQDNPAAILQLSYCYLHEKATKKDLHKAAELCLRAVALGYKPAIAEYGYLMTTGIAFDKNAEKGIKLLRDAARGDEPKAKYYLAVLALNGTIKEDDETNPEKLLLAAARNNLSVASELLGDLYTEGNRVQKDLMRARMWYAQSSAHGNYQACYKNAQLRLPPHEASPDLFDAMRVLLPAANSGHGKSQELMGRLCIKMHEHLYRAPQDSAFVRARSIDPIRVVQAGVSESIDQKNGLIVDALMWFSLAIDSGGIGEIPVYEKEFILLHKLSEEDVKKAENKKNSFNRK